MRILAIDPGKMGAIVVVDFMFANMCPDVTFYDIPILKIKKTGKTKNGNKKIKTEYDLFRINDIIKESDVFFAYLERQQAFPGQGSVSMFSIGNGYGMYKALLTAYNIPYDIVSPKEWQKYYGIAGKKGNTKDQAYLIASKLFPGAVKDFKTKRGRLIDGRVDSLLIAGYGARILEVRK